MGRSANKQKQRKVKYSQYLRKCKYIFIVIDKAEDWREEFWVQMIKDLEWHDKEFGLHHPRSRNMTLEDMMHVDLSRARIEMTWLPKRLIPGSKMCELGAGPSVENRGYVQEKWTH